MEDIENLRRTVADAYDVMIEEDELTGFIADIGPYYVQFAKSNALAHLGQDGTIMMEAVHNVYLGDEHRIDSDQEANIMSLGFELAEDDMGPINWRKWGDIDNCREELIDSTVSAFDKVYHVVPGNLKITFV